MSDCSRTIHPDRCFLFDLGGVLIRLADRERAVAWSGGQLTAPQIDRLWRGSPLVAGFEVGACTEREFAAEMIRQYRLSCTAQELLDEFREYVIEPWPGARQMLQKLRNCGIVACLSNTNPLHWRKMEQEMAILDCFDRCFASHLIKHRKPSPEAYRFVVDRLAVEPKNILFFDDNQENVEAARQLGIRACRVDGVPGLKTALRQHCPEIATRP